MLHANTVHTQTKRTSTWCWYDSVIYDMAKFLTVHMQTLTNDFGDIWLFKHWKAYSCPGCCHQAAHTSQQLRLLLYEWRAGPGLVCLPGSRSPLRTGWNVSRKPWKLWGLCRGQARPSRAWCCEEKGAYSHPSDLE